MLLFTPFYPLLDIVLKEQGAKLFFHILLGIELPLIHLVANCGKEPAGPLPGIKGISLLIGVKLDPPLAGPGEIHKIALWGSKT
jgi:hypothetical protein